MNLQERADKKARLAALHRKINTFGTPEKDYLDSGLWLFLRFVRTKDEHDPANPVKPLPTDPDTGEILPYIKTVFHHLLRYDQLALPKSRQIMMSWILAIWANWRCRTASHRRVVWQSQKDGKAAEMISMGGDDPETGRVTFLEFHLTNPDGSPATWLMDPKIVDTSGDGKMSGKGVLYNKVLRKNGSYCQGIPQGGDQVNSAVPSDFINDESAKQEEFGPSFVSVQPCLTGGGRGVYASSADAGAYCDLVNDYDGYLDDAPPPVHLYPEENARLPKGMKFWKVRGEIAVLQTHYSADPNKDPDRYGAEWVEKASAVYGGIHSAGWQREMEINWKATGGAPVFAFAQDSRWPAIIPARKPADVWDGYYRFLGFDYGTREDPSVAVVWSVDKDGNCFSDWEWFKHGAHYKEAARAIKDCPYYQQVKYRMVADHSLWAMTQQQDAAIKSLAQLFSAEGIDFIQAKKGSPSADVRVAEMFLTHYWADFAHPKAFMTLATPKVIECVKMLRWEEHRSESAKARSHALQKIVHKNNDPWDATAYPFDILLSNFKVPEIKLPPNSYRAVRNRMDRDEKRAEWATGNIGAL